jgi:hypothetical protein
MLKKAMTGIFFVALLGLFGASASADGDDLCDDLVFSSEHLEGLCEAICDAVECEVEDGTSDDDSNDGSSDDSSDDDCQPPSPSLIVLYNGLKGPNDPDLPCIAAECPCYDRQQVESIPHGSCYSACTTDFVLPGGEIQNQIVGLTSSDLVYVIEGATTNFCQLAPNALQEIDAVQATACRAILQDVQFQSGLCPTTAGAGDCPNPAP